MENLKFKTGKGAEVELSAGDIYSIYMHYFKSKIRDRLKMCYPEWSDFVLDEMVGEAVAQIEMNENIENDLPLAVFLDNEEAVASSHIDKAIVDAIKFVEMNFEELIGVRPAEYLKTFVATFFE